MDRDLTQLEWERAFAKRAREARTGETKTLSADEVDRLLALTDVVPNRGALDDVS